jgi:RNA-directed DNA polymerase
MLPEPLTEAQRAWAADNLATRLLAGAWTVRAIAAVLRSARLRGRAALARGVFALGERGYPPAPVTLRRFLILSGVFAPAAKPAAAVLEPPRFAPIGVFAGLSIPALATPGDLAAWLGVTAEHLDWLSDVRRGHGGTREMALQHYRYSVVTKRSGGTRLLEAPKPRLKAIQRRILHEILDVVPVHDGAHGFVAGRSCLTGARRHAGEAVVATFDLAQFFPSIGSPRVHGLFRCLGYPWAVARALTGLCTTITPASVMPGLEELYRVPHLPQGAPTSPALANLLAWPLDRRLAQLAEAAGAYYSRYADDLAFSGDTRFARGLGRFGATVEAIVREEGFVLNPTKTRVMPRHGRQRVTGVVVNGHCNVGREAFDTLKAILHNCVVRGRKARTQPVSPIFAAISTGGWHGWRRSIPGAVRSFACCSTGSNGGIITFRRPIIKDEAYKFQ